MVHLMKGHQKVRMYDRSVLLKEMSEGKGEVLEVTKRSEKTSLELSLPHFEPLIRAQIYYSLTHFIYNTSEMFEQSPSLFTLQNTRMSRTRYTKRRQAFYIIKEYTVHWKTRDVFSLLFQKGNYSIQSPILALLLVPSVLVDLSSIHLTFYYLISNGIIRGRVGTECLSSIVV